MYPRPRPAHGVVQHLEAGGLDDVEVHHLADLALVGGPGVDHLDAAAPLGLVQVGQQDGVGIDDPGDLFLEACNHLRRGRAGVLRLVLDAEVRRRVVAGGEDDRPRGSKFEDRPRADLRRGGVLRQVGLDPGGGGDPRDLGGKAVGAEAAVIPNDHLRVRVPRKVVGDPLGGVAHVLEREVVGDDAAPAVGAELDLRARAERRPGLHSHRRRLYRTSPAEGLEGPWHGGRRGGRLMPRNLRAG